MPSSESSDSVSDEDGGGGGGGGGEWLAFRSALFSAGSQTVNWKSITSSYSPLSVGHSSVVICSYDMVESKSFVGRGFFSFRILGHPIFDALNAFCLLILNFDM